LGKYEGSDAVGSQRSPTEFMQCRTVIFTSAHLMYVAVQNITSSSDHTVQKKIVSVSSLDVVGYIPTKINRGNKLTMESLVL